MKYVRTALVLGLMVASCELLAAPPKADEATTKAILEHHWKTFTENDLDGTLVDYTEDSILITPNRTYKGLSEIRENFVKAFGNFPAGASTRKLDKSVVERDVGYIIWEGTGPKTHLNFGTDTFVIRNGKILTQTFGGVGSDK